MPRRTAKFYFKNEKETMKKLGLTPTIRSGGGWIEKEDGHNDYVITQHKSTDAESYKITRTDLRKLEYHALVDKKLPLFVIEFLSDGALYLIIKPEDLVEIVNYIAVPESLSDVKSESLEIPEKTTTTANEVKPIKSGNKDKYWKALTKEKEKQKYASSKKLKTR